MIKEIKKLKKSIECAEFEPDCQDKHSLDIPLLSISSRIWGERWRTGEYLKRSATGYTALVLNCENGEELEIDRSIEFNGTNKEVKAQIKQYAIDEFIPIIEKMIDEEEE